MICESLKAKKEILMVIMAEGVSENTRKRLSDRCGFYGVRLEIVKVTTAELAHALGKSGELAAVALVDMSFAEGIKNLL
jgi:ribosomal protein L7Ae-like RNA K-turn-binding protein